MYSTSPAADAARHYSAIYQRADAIESVRRSAFDDFIGACLEGDLDAKPAWCSRPITVYLSDPYRKADKVWEDRRATVIENIAAKIDEDDYADAERVAIARVLVLAWRHAVPGAVDILTKAAQRFADHEADMADEGYEE